MRSCSFGCSSMMFLSQIVNWMQRKFLCVSEIATSRRLLSEADQAIHAKCTQTTTKMEQEVYRLWTGINNCWLSKNLLNTSCCPFSPVPTPQVRTSKYGIGLQYILHYCSIRQSNIVRTTQLIQNAVGLQH